MISFTHNDKNKLTLVTDYLIKQIKVNVERDLLNDTLLNSIEILIVLNELEQFHKAINLRIQSLLNTNNTIYKILEKKENLERLIKYSKSLLIHNRTYLLDSIVNEFENYLLKPSDISSKWTNAYKYTIDIYDESFNILKRLSKYFAAIYKNSYGLFDLIKLSENQLKWLIDDELKLYIVTRIAIINDQDKYYADLVYLLSKTDFNKGLEESILNKINTLNPNFTHKQVLEITIFLKTINKALKYFNNREISKKEEVDKLYNLIISDRMVQNPQFNVNAYPPQPQVIPKNYLNESINNSDDVREIVVFLLHIYRVSPLTVSTYLTKLLAQPSNREIINEELINLSINYKLELLLFTSIIFSDTTYSKNTLILLSILIRQKKIDADTFENYDDIKSTFNIILNIIFLKDGRSYDLQNFLEEMCTNEKLKTLLIELITNRKPEEILLLSNKLKGFVIDIVLVENRIYDFEDNNDFLKLVAKTGTVQHYEKLHKVIVTKLIKGDDLLSAFLIIKELNTLTSEEASELKREIRKHNKKEDYKEEIKQVIQFIDKITTTS